MKGLLLKGALWRRIYNDNKKGGVGEVEIISVVQRRGETGCVHGGGGVREWGEEGEGLYCDLLLQSKFKMAFHEKSVIRPINTRNKVEHIPERRGESLS